MIKISQGKIRLEDRIIDISALEVRPKTTENDLKGHYGSFIEHAEEIGGYFEDRSAFDRALKDSAENKSPKLIPREPKYPSMLRLFNPSFMPFGYLNPSNRRLEDYFIAAHCITAIPRKNKSNAEEQTEKPLDGQLREDITKKFKQFPGYEGIIEIPDDRNSAATKATTFHEALHYLIARYQSETDRNFVNVFVKEELPRIERYQAEHLIHERAVEILTDRLLVHDKDALFEARWSFYSLANEGFRMAITIPTAIATGVLLASSLSNPYLLPLAFIPGRIREMALERYRQSKKEELVKPIEYPKFKI